MSAADKLLAALWARRSRQLRRAGRKREAQAAGAKAFEAAARWSRRRNRRDGH